MALINSALAALLMIMMAVISYYLREEKKDQKAINAAVQAELIKLNRELLEEKQTISAALEELHQNRLMDSKRQDNVEKLVKFIAKKSNVDLP